MNITGGYLPVACWNNFIHNGHMGRETALNLQLDNSPRNQQTVHSQIR